MKNKLMGFCLPFFLVLLIFYLLTNHELVTAGAAGGLLLWYQNVLPVLFPYMVLSAVLLNENIRPLFLVPFHKLLLHSQRMNETKLMILLTGIFCGTPAAVKNLTDSLKKGLINEKEAESLLAYTTFPSFFFLTGYVYPLIRDRVKLSIFLFSIYLPAGFIALMQENTIFSGYQIRDSDTPKNGFSLNQSILESFSALTLICGYLMIFSILGLLIRNSSLIPETGKMLLSLSLEITSGISYASHISSPITVPLIGAASSFGGISFLMQAEAFLENQKRAGLFIRHYFFWKTVHAALTFILLFTADQMSL